MMVFKRKQIVVLSLVLMIIVAGYLQYSYRKSSVSTAGKEEGRLGEAVYVEGDGDVPEDGVAIDEAGEEKPASKLANDYFAQAKVDKDTALSRDREVLREITEDVNASSEVKAEAFDKMMALVESSQKEANIETLVKKIGFSDAIVLFGEDGSVDIVVKTPGLSTSQVAQITDIASRHGEVELEKVFVKNLY